LKQYAVKKSTQIQLSTIASLFKQESLANAKGNKRQRHSGACLKAH